MADISRITDINGNTYDIKDATARANIPSTYAGSPSAAGPATRTAAIPSGQVDSTSTATVFTATVEGVTALYDGVCVLLKNGVVTSTTGFTININGLGAKPVYSNMAAATAEKTIFNVDYTMLFVYDSTRVSGGCWVCYRGYNSDNNTVGYQLRTNATVLKTVSRTRYYRLLFTSADGSKWVPANTEYNNSAVTVKTVNQTKINPFGRIVYLATSTNFPADADVAANVIWDQYTFVLGYSFNTTGAALTLTVQKPVYIVCVPQTDGSAIIDSTTPYVQDLPVTADGKIYIYLGIAYDETHVELVAHHPIYFHDGTRVRLWTDQDIAAPFLVTLTGSGSTLTADYTAAEIYAAYSAGKRVVAQYNKWGTQMQYYDLVHAMYDSGSSLYSLEFISYDIGWGDTAGSGTLYTVSVYWGSGSTNTFTVRGFALVPTNPGAGQVLTGTSGGGMTWASPSGSGDTLCVTCTLDQGQALVTNVSATVAEISAAFAAHKWIYMITYNTSGDLLSGMWAPSRFTITSGSEHFRFVRTLIQNGQCVIQTVKYQNGEWGYETQSTT